MGGHAKARTLLRGSHGRWLFVIAASAIAVLPAKPAYAQTATTAPSNQLCYVFTVDAVAGGPKELRASCKGHGFIFGGTTEYHVVTNDTLKTVVIDNRFGSERHVMLIAVGDDGQPHAEDITGDLAHAAGRGVMSGLRGLDVNLDGFASSGAIAVSPSAGDTAPAKNGQVDIGHHMAAEAVRQSQAAAQK
jgi:hypothetical protein